MKKQKMLQKVWLVLIGMVVLSACSGAPVQLGTESNEKYDSTRYRQISAEACGFQLFLFFPIATNDRAERAYRALKVRAGDDYIADIKVIERWTYAFVGTVYCTAMEATAYPKVRT